MPPPEQLPGMFHNVYIEPSAYEHFVRTGKFREKTMLAMTLYEPGQKVHPSKQGFFEGDFIAVEVTLKDSERFPGSWAYFNFGKGTKGSRAVAMPRQALPVVPCQERRRRQRLRAVLSRRSARVSTKFDRDTTLSATASRPARDDGLRSIAGPSAPRSAPRSVAARWLLASLAGASLHRAPALRRRPSRRAVRRSPGAGSSAWPTASGC